MISKIGKKISILCSTQSSVVRWINSEAIWLLNGSKRPSYNWNWKGQSATSKIRNVKSSRKRIKSTIWKLKWKWSTRLIWQTWRISMLRSIRLSKKSLPWGKYISSGNKYQFKLNCDEHANLDILECNSRSVIVKEKLRFLGWMLKRAHYVNDWIEPMPICCTLDARIFVCVTKYRV